MPGLISTESESAKILYIGDSGHGKTGSKASLIALGYKIRMIDTDNGFKILRSLLTDADHYPYASWMKKTGIDPTEPGRISYIPISVPIGVNEVSIRRKTGTSVNYHILAPTDSRGWKNVVNLLISGWVDDGVDYGKVTDWGADTILDFDTLSTLAELAQYWNQDMNGRLGALEDDHGRDAGAAQELIRRLMLQLTSPSIKSNVILTTHITRVDTSRGAPLSPEQLLRENKSVDARGFPSVIGRALSPVLGKRWNDQFIVARDGNGSSAERKIYSVPKDNTDAKHSVYVEPSYSLTTGLAEIFCALQYKPAPIDFVEHCRKFYAERGKSEEISSPKSGFSPPRTGFQR